MPTHTRVNQSTITPSVRLAGTYFLKVWRVQLGSGAEFWRGCAHRQGPVATLGFERLTAATGATRAAVVSELRRNVRNARKAGGL